MMVALPTRGIDQRGLPGALVGLGVMLLAATAPVQITLASKMQPSGWLTGLTATATVGAGAAAFGAAYYSFHQARQAGLSRRAEFVAPVVQEAMKHLRELEGVLTSAAGLVSAAQHIGAPGDRLRAMVTGVVEDFRRLADEIWSQGDVLAALGEQRAAGGMILVGAKAFFVPSGSVDQAATSGWPELQQLEQIHQAAEGPTGLVVAISRARDTLREVLQDLVAPW